MLYAIKDTISGLYLEKTSSGTDLVRLKKATIWKRRSAAEDNLSYIKRCRGYWMASLEIVEISEKKYQKAVKGRFSPGDKVIHAEFASDITCAEPFLVQELEIVKELPHSYTTSDGTIWLKDKIGNLTTHGKFLLANAEEVEFIKELRTKEIVMNRLKTINPRRRELWQQILISLDKDQK